MDKKILLKRVLIGVIIILLLGLVGFFLYKFGFKKGQNSVSCEKSSILPSDSTCSATCSNPNSKKPVVQSSNSNNKNENENSSGVSIDPRERQPQIITGKISSLDDSKITIKQFSSTEVDYNFNKEDFSSILALRKNPNYNAEKARAKQAEISQLIASEGQKKDENFSDSKLPSGSSDAVQQKVEEYKNDSESQFFVETKIEWSELKMGDEITINTEKDGTMKIVVNTKEFSGFQQP